METNRKDLFGPPVPEASDSVLRQALTSTETPKLPSNFAHVTLRRIERERKAREHREHIAALATVTACLLLGITVTGWFYGTALLAALQTMSRQSESFDLIPAIAFCCLFFALLNHYLRRRYAKGE